jgi:cell division transport system permease protein
MSGKENMAMRINLGRHTREGFLNLFRNGWMSFASAMSIAISLFILGAFILLSLNVNYLTTQLESEVEISVFLTSTNTVGQNAGVEGEILKISGIKDVTFVSKEDGLLELKKKMGKENAEIIELYDGDANPLPDKFVVRAIDANDVANIASRIEAINEGKSVPPIASVEWGQDFVEKLLDITKVIRNIGIVLVLGLTVTAMFLISNTIKLTIVNRKREIAIMKLVGATNYFIRFPFFIEGMLLGIIGSIVPIGLLIYGYSVLVEKSQASLAVMQMELLAWGDVVLQISVLLVSLGVVLGIWGTTVSVRKFLKV